MLTPAGTAIHTLRISMNQIILLVGTRNVPHLPFAFVVDQIGFIDAAMFPFLIGDEDRLRLIEPL